MVTDKSPNQFEFQGFQSPNTTQVPDELFDKLLTVLSHSELKVLLYIIRRTFGFKKDSDNISLNQMLRGITTKDGRVLDQGAGLSKPSLLQALRGLQEKKIIMIERRRSIEKGNEPTIYKLRFAAQGQEQNRESHPPLVKSFDQGVGEEILPRARAKNLTTQQTVLQETVKQHDDVVGQALQNFGVSKSVATKLAKTYPEVHIMDKLELAQWLASTGSPLVARNPAGWLRKAIEEDYAPPRNYESNWQRQTREVRDEKMAQVETKQRRIAEAEYKRVKAETKAQLLEDYPPQPIGEEGLTTESVWDLTMQRLKEEVPTATYETWLKDTVLLQVTDTAARIAVPSAFAVAWLERRMYQGISRSLKEVLHREVDLQFVVGPLATAAQDSNAPVRP